MRRGWLWEEEDTNLCILPGSKLTRIADGLLAPPPSTAILVSAIVMRCGTTTHVAALAIKGGRAKTGQAETQANKEQKPKTSACPERREKSHKKEEELADKRQETRERFIG
jgi:hypothetical protein